jgi:8-hydroxy-5-deazaflavin:NADPH oxidoreductase
VTRMKNFVADRRQVLGAGLFAGLAMGLGESARAQPAATPNQPRRIGIIGAGHIGGTVGTLWVKAGHPVMFATRHPEELAALVKDLGPLARTGTVADALAFGDAVLIAVPYRAYPEIGRDNAAALRDKVVLDAGNAVPARDGDIAAEARENGIGETSAKYLTGARVVRAFNTLGYRVLQSNANRPGERMAIPIAGDNAAALALASDLIGDAGFEPVVVGPLVSAREFAQGAPLYGLQVSAAELRRRIETMK